MRIAIISDIHGNWAALDAVLADLRTRPTDAVYCLGDLVGYAAHPNAVAERVQAEGIPTVMGNYDDGVGFERDECGCAYTNPVDRALGDQSLAWTKAAVTSENKAYLRTLASEIRLEADGRRVLLVHGSPRRINEYLFEVRPVWRACYLVLDTADTPNPVHFIRVPYDLASEAAAMRASALPDRFAADIEAGGATVANPA